MLNWNGIVWALNKGPKNNRSLLTLYQLKMWIALKRMHLEKKEKSRRVNRKEFWQPVTCTHLASLPSRPHSHQCWSWSWMRMRKKRMMVTACSSPIQSLNHPHPLVWLVEHSGTPEGKCQRGLLASHSLVGLVGSWPPPHALVLKSDSPDWGPGQLSPLVTFQQEHLGAEAMVRQCARYTVGVAVE